jgi:hypothetical protein
MQGAAPAVESHAVAPAAAVATQAQPLGQTLVRCEPHQQAAVDQSIVAGRLVTSIECVGSARASSAPRQVMAARDDFVGLGHPPAGDPYGASAAAPVAYRSPSVRPAVVRGGYDDEVVVERRSGRTWKKRALVIGGSTGVGAGVGGLIAGKKGALIGAAIGGGGGAIYEATRK